MTLFEIVFKVKLFNQRQGNQICIVKLKRKNKLFINVAANTIHFETIHNACFLFCFDNCNSDCRLPRLKG